MSACNEKQATLFYPRTEQELDYVWNFHTSLTQGPKQNGTIFLHAGYVKTFLNASHAILNSVDGKVQFLLPVPEPLEWIKRRLRISNNVTSFSERTQCSEDYQDTIPEQCDSPPVNSFSSVCFLDLLLESRLLYWLFWTSPKNRFDKLEILVFWKKSKQIPFLSLIC